MGLGLLSLRRVWGGHCVFDVFELLSFYNFNIKEIWVLYVRVSLHGLEGLGFKGLGLRGLGFRVGLECLGCC